MNFDKNQINMVDGKKAKKTVVATGIGNAMEWFDFGVYAYTTLRPYLSPIIPKTIPPIGLNKNAIAKAAKVNICCICGLSTGEKKFAPMYAVV